MAATDLPNAARIAASKKGKSPQTVFRQARALLRVIRDSKQRRWILGLAVGIVGVIMLTTLAQLRLNRWQGSFYDALNRLDVPEFIHQLYVFAAIVVALVICAVSQAWCQEMLKVRLREGLTRHLLGQWLLPKQAYRLALQGDIGVNPDQRVQEDARHLCELTASLGIGLFQASILLVSFVGVLWGLSDQVSFRVHGQPMVIPGYMVWCAIIYALGGTIAAFLIGRPLVRLNVEHYAREAELRYSLVRIGESAEGIALYGGEHVERRIIEQTLTRVLEVMKRLATGLARLTWVTSSYGYIALVFPIVVASPGYFAGTLSLGQLMMVVGAFNQVQQALRWWVDNFPIIADWRATLQRVMSLEAALRALGEIDSETSRITAIEDPEGRLGFEDLRIQLPDGEAVFAETMVEIVHGEHVQIIGETGAGKVMLFRALAGLWPAGSGILRLPQGEAIAFLPHHPYLPPGTLREVVTYPEPAGTYEDAAVRAALERIGLGHLAPNLDRIERWNRDLPLAEQQSLSFARILLRRPRWVILEQVLDGFDSDGQQRLLGIFTDTLPETSVISIDPVPSKDPFFTRTLHLMRVPAADKAV